MERLILALSMTEPTYEDVGGTVRGIRPAGFRNDHYEAEIGRGSSAFARAVTGLHQWKAHEVRGVRVFPEGAEVRTGTTVIVTLGTPALALAAPCRVVGIIDGEDRWGFAYGTLPGHPEQGEECFTVSLSADGLVRFEITAFSRPGDSLTRFSGPVGRAIQRRGTNGYLAALRRYVAHGS
jgi:uncharacterized protein (UPF0548 family)